jgi:hypothetical protein
MVADSSKKWPQGVSPRHKTAANHQTTAWRKALLFNERARLALLQKSRSSLNG